MDKYIVLLIAIIILVTGCTNLSNTPTKKTEELLNNYQTLDDEVLNDLNNVINNLDNYTTSEKDRYKEIMKKQYQNMIYKIKNQTINGNDASVIVEITVLDLYKVEQEVNSYLSVHKMDTNESIDYKLDKLEKATDKVTYTLDIKLTKIDNKWNINGLSSDDINKISGTYAY